MENGGGLFTNARHQRGQNGNISNYGLLPGSRVDLGTSTTTRRRTSGSYPLDEPPTPAATPSESSGVDAAPPMYEFRACHHYIHPFYHHPPPPYSAAGGGGDGTHRHLFPDSHFFDLASPHHLLGGGHMVGLKRGRSDLTGGGGAEQPRSLPAAAVARCQVDGCHAALDHAKEYHRRHKVCEMHSKAPKVVLLGVDQRFCQQCSRFHAVTEFDDTKRSCRRRLAGHNQRRRKTSPHDSTNPSQDNKLITGDRCSYLSTSPGRARSLLSSKADSWVSESDLSSRSSAALRELIEENRAAVLARQLILMENGNATTAQWMTLKHPLLIM